MKRAEVIDGRPFFAMEFIRGMPLDEYARSHDLDLPARLELLAKVCDAVQHAHDKGVIHRDLKPGNILVEESGQPKVLDFGVAHVTAADVLTTSSQTQTGQLLGTLNYMSPEQLAARPGGLDGRSDVYTLGVILFELLAHRLPYHLDQLPVHEVARVIEQQEPSRLGSIDKLYRGDVAIIVAKALEKDKRQRYASAGDLASDIRRYLNGEAILAREVSPSGTMLAMGPPQPLHRRAWRRSRGLADASSRSGRSWRLAGSQVWPSVNSASRERAARLDADLARNTAEAANTAAQAETYRALLSEVKALAGRTSAWLARGSPRRSLATGEHADAPSGCRRAP